MAFTTRLVLAAVFALAGIAKLLDRAGARRSLREFGVADALTRPLALLLPFAELSCAAALLTGAFAWWGAAGAFALLALFIAAIVVNLARGRTPDCHCFGKLHSEPIGWSTVYRNIVLAALAVFVLVQSPAHAGPGLVVWLRSLTAIESMFALVVLALAALAVFQVTMVVQLLAQNGRMMLRIEALEAKLGNRVEPAPPPAGLPVTTEAPAFSLQGLDGIPVTLETLRGLNKPLLLLFTETGCPACELILADVGRWQREHADRLLVVPIGRGDLNVNRAKALRHGLEHALVQTNREVAEAYQVQGTPSAVLLKDGLVASPLAAGPDEIRALMFGATLPDPVTKGDAAPSLELRDLDGKPVDIAAPRGRRKVLLFWNPSCGFCKAMLGDVRSWERTRSRNAPELLVVSAGSAEANRQQRFRSPVVLDPIFGAAGVFGATGTPSAIVLDENGRVASDVGVGATAVLSMLGAVPASGVPG
jgi:thiol-disulfide isomerase/thioredoxin/uncharacterized membrane protein YphA (DoxX/SURF4 family)